MSSSSTSPAAKDNAVVFGPEELPIFRVRGGDAVRYLHGRLTQDVKGLAEGHAKRALILTPQGRIQGHLVLLREAEGFLVVSDPLPDEETRKVFTSALMQFKVADDVSLHETNYKRLTVIGTLAGRWPPMQPSTNLTFVNTDSTVVLRRDRGSVIAYEIFGESPAVEALRTELIGAGAASGNSDAFEMLRIAAKIPQMGSELSEKVLGPEVDVEQVVSFDKGCYSGQEVVEMATARGRPNRMLSLFEGVGREAPAQGTEVFLPEDSKAVGIITSTCLLRGEGKVLALGFVKTPAADAPLFLAGGVELKRLG